MKKRFFSSLLMGALVTATLSTVTSCKDYDDDISNLQGQIDKLATADQLAEKVKELQGLISANSTSITSLQTAVEKAQKAAEAAQTTADQKATLDQVKEYIASQDFATKKYVDDADAILDAAIKAIQTKDIKDLQDAVAKAQKAAEDAQATADQAVKDAKAAQDAADLANSEDGEAYKKAVAAADAAKTVAEDLAKLQKSIGAGYSEAATVKDAIAAINKLLEADNTGLKGLDSRLDVVEKALKGAEEGSTLDVSAKIAGIEKSLKDIIGEYTTMVTSVSLYKTSANRYSNGLPDNDLTFIWVPSEHSTKFPLNADLVDNQIVFDAANKNITTTDSLVIRVSPTNAELTPANISLINSQGKELSEFVDVQSVKPYKKLITGATRASETEGNGLWTVTFKLKDGADMDKFAEAAISENNYVQFAVAVKNTESSATRRVISAYDVTTKGAEYEPASSGILVQGNDDVWKDIKVLRNRFNLGVQNNAYSVESPNERAKNEVHDLEWADQSYKPYTAEEAAGHTTDAVYDQRSQSYKQLLPVSLGKKINISVASLLDNDGYPKYYSTTTGRGYAVKGFYVTLDKDFAIESAPSELNAWAKYSYENVGVTNSKGQISKKATMFYGNEGNITIKALDDTEVKGDIIGFRVYVVNLDGTLVDPDGRAFYVKVGETKNQQAAAANAAIADKSYFTTTGNESNFYADFAINNDFNFDAEYDGYLSITNWTIDQFNNPGDLGNNPILPSSSDYNVKYLDKDGNITTNLEDAKTVRVFLLNPQKFVDGGEYTLKATLYDRNREIRDLTLKVTKVMPVAADIASLEYVNSAWVATNIFTNVDMTDANIYKFGYGTVDSDGYSKVKTKEMSEYLTDLKSTAAQHYKLWFESLNVEEPEITYAAPYGTTYKYEIDRHNIDGQAHNIAYAYDFGPISLTHNWVTGGWISPSDYWVNAANKKSMNFKTWIDFASFAWTAAQDITWTAGTGKGSTKSFGFDKIKATNSLLGRFNNQGLDALISNLYTKVKDVQFDNDAFSATFNGTAIVLTQETETTVPNTSGNLKVTVEDCFGHTKDFSLAVTIKRQ